MRCPKCECIEDKVIDSRSSKEGAIIRRRRECAQCTHRFTTYEQIEHQRLMVVKRDGRREEFARDKQENKFFDAWLKTSPKLNTPAARDIIWRCRGTHAAKYLADIILDKATAEADKPRYLRALDFIPKGKERDKALARIALGL